MNFKKLFATMVLVISALTLMPGQAMASWPTTKSQMVGDSFQYTGTPYRWAGSTPSGFDCSGFIYYMYRTHGLWMPRTTTSRLWTMGTTIGRYNLQRGDLVFFSHNQPGVVGHVGIYVGNNKFISATSTRGIWTYTMFGNSYWGPKYLGARRI